jgi:hypothetical protein
MARWICPECEREFARARQSHTCVPGGTVDETFAGRPAYQRAAYDVIMAHIESLGPVHIDAVRVGVFLKSDRKFAEIRPMARALSVYIMAPQAVRHRLLARSVRIGADRVWSVLRLRAEDDVDDDLLDVLAAAYDSASDS